MPQLHSLAVRATAYVAFFALSFATAEAQDAAKSEGVTAKPLAYAVATVKPHGNDLNSGFSASPDGRLYRGMTLKLLVLNAYLVREMDLVIGGPKWINDDAQRWDVQVKVDDADVAAYKKLKPKEQSAMLQPVLEDRFKLKIHTEMKEVPVYELVLAKGGPKVHEMTPEQEAAYKKRTAGMSMHMGSNAGEINATRAEDLANMLSGNSGRIVIDKTGLAGKYELSLKWAYSNSPDSAPEGSDAPSLFPALEEQLGLKLQPAKAMMGAVVVDSASKPEEN